MAQIDGHYGARFGRFTSTRTARIEQLVALREKTKKAIVASSYAGTLGVPALFHRSCADELLHLDEGSGAKAVIASNHERVTEFTFPEGKIDIDTAADYDRLCVSED